MPTNRGRSNSIGPALRSMSLSRQARTPESAILPHVVTTINGSDKLRTHFTFTNIGLTSVFSVSVETVRQGESTLDFEIIEELRPGASLTRHAIVNPMIDSDPHWTSAFWSDSGDELTAPFIVRYKDECGRPIVMRNTLRWNRRHVYLIPDRAPEPA